MKVFAVFFIGNVRAAEVIDLVAEAGENPIELILTVIVHFVL